MDAITGYEIFRDLITIFLAVAALVGVVLYKILSYAIERKATLATETQLDKALLGYHISSGYDYWKEYKHTEEVWKLDQAINVTKKGYDDCATELEKRDRDLDSDSEWLICWVKNNLAYYYAEKQKLGTATLGDKALAQRFIKYVYARIDKCPKKGEESEAWVDTYNFVQQQFSLNR